MASISINLEGYRPRLGIRTDPNKPPDLVEKLLDISLPKHMALYGEDLDQIASLPVKRVLSCLHAMSDKEGKTHVSTRHRLPSVHPRTIQRDLCIANTVNADCILAGIAKYIQLVVDTLNKSSDMLTLMLEPIDHVVLVTPSYFSCASTTTLMKIDQKLKEIQVSLITYPAATILFHGQGRLDASAFIDICWNDAIRVGRRSYPDGKAEELAVLGTDRVLLNTSRAKWREVLMDWLDEKCRSEMDGKLLGDLEDDSDYCAWLKESCEDLLSAVLDHKRQFQINYHNWTYEFDQQEMENLTALLFVGPANFLRNSLNEKKLKNVQRRLVFHGKNMELQAVQCALKDVLREYGVEADIENADAIAAMGAVYGATVPNRAPYDCGVLIRQYGTEEGTGTLLIKRGSPAGTAQKSPNYNWNKRHGDVVEVVFYIRIVDFSIPNIEYSFSRKTICFSPARDKAGNTSFYIVMNLNTDDKGRVKTVTTIVHDNNDKAKKSYQFPPMPFNGGDPAAGRIRRGHPASKILLNMIQRISDPGADNWSIAKWRQVLDPPKGLVPKFYYLLEIFSSDLTLNPTLLEQLMSCSPEQVQRQAQDHLFNKMQMLAAKINGPNVKSWQRKYTINQQKEELVRDFRNSIYQDAANDAETISSANRLTNLYSTACLPPDHLIIDWENTINELFDGARPDGI